MLRTKEKVEGRDLILLALNFFYEYGEREVSLSEILECFQQIRDKIPTKYEFTERFLYSADLVDDLRNLNYYGYIRQFTYRHDAFLPKTYYLLTELGRGHSKRVLDRIPDNYLHVLNKSVKSAMEKHHKRWRFWARPSRQFQESEEPTIQ